MGSTQQLKGRISSVKSTKQITKAMELVSASKMRKAQAQAVSTRDYRIASGEILKRIGGVHDVANHPLFITRPIKNRLVIMITSERGLAGAYNSSVIKRFIAQVHEDKKAKIDTKVVAIGKLGATFAAKFDPTDLVQAYPMFENDPKPSQIRPIVHNIFDLYTQEKVDAVDIIYTHYVSNITQEVRYLNLLPTIPEGDDTWSKLEVAIFEPGIDTIVEPAVTRLIEGQIWQAILESLASEHSARMLAMKNATDNASDIIDDLTLEYNTARQADITQQIAEITGGAEAIAE